MTYRKNPRGLAPQLHRSEGAGAHIRVNRSEELSTIGVAMHGGMGQLAGSGSEALTPTPERAPRGTTS